MSTPTSKIYLDSYLEDLLQGRALVVVNVLAVAAGVAVLAPLDPQSKSDN